VSDLKREMAEVRDRMAKNFAVVGQCLRLMDVVDKWKKAGPHEPETERLLAELLTALDGEAK
jgi:hypothetical protein